MSDRPSPCHLLDVNNHQEGDHGKNRKYYVTSAATSAYVVCVDEALSEAKRSRSTTYGSLGVRFM